MALAGPTLAGAMAAVDLINPGPEPADNPCVASWATKSGPRGDRATDANGDRRFCARCGSPLFDARCPSCDAPPTVDADPPTNRPRAAQSLIAAAVAAAVAVPLALGLSSPSPGRPASVRTSAHRLSLAGWAPTTRSSAPSATASAISRPRSAAIPTSQPWPSGCRRRSSPSTRRTDTAPASPCSRAAATPPSSPTYTSSPIRGTTASTSWASGWGTAR